MRCLLLQHNGNSNANGVAEGEDFQVGGAFPQLEAAGRLGAGQRLPSRESRCKAEPCPSESTH
jgi:hypothetical protein